MLLINQRHYETFAKEFDCHFCLEPALFLSSFLFHSVNTFLLGVSIISPPNIKQLWLIWRPTGVNVQTQDHKLPLPPLTL